ncbi:MAG TPA: DUF11 domain-containing protein, partial [Paracoccus sp.]|nr:DUF11 domain-containing protein [Paracoccus sp. (in: a-proteobacteria)]
RTPENDLIFHIPQGGSVTAVAGGLSPADCLPALPLQGPAALTCKLPPMNPTEVLQATFDMVASEKGVLNYSFVVDPESDSNPSDNTISSTTTINAGADLALEITGPATAAAGEVVALQAVVTNEGPDAVSGAVVRIPVTDGLVNYSFPPECVLTGGAYFCTVPGPLAQGESNVFSFGAQVGAASSSNLIVLGSVSQGPNQPADPSPANNSDSLEMDISGGSDLAISKTRAPSSGLLLVDDKVSFTLSSRYTGDVPNGIVIEDTLPVAYSVDDIVAPGWDCSTSAGQLVRCEMQEGSTAGANVSLGDIVITATVVQAGAQVRNTATIAADGPEDPNTANNTAQDAQVDIEVPAPMLEGIKRGQTPALISAGQNYDFRLGATNTGNVPYVGTITLTDVLPAELSYVSHQAGEWDCTDTAGTVTCVITYSVESPLPVGASTPIATLTTQADPDLATSVNISNTLDISATGIDGGIPSISAPIRIDTAGLSADLVVTKTAQSPSVTLGDIQVFNISVRNIGPNIATNIAVTDTLTGLINDREGAENAGFVGVEAPAGTSCTSLSAGGQSRALACTIAQLAMDDEVQIAVTVRPGSAGGSNTAEAYSQNVADPVWSNNSASAEFTLNPVADLRVEKRTDKNEVPAGQELTYVIAVSNADSMGGVPYAFSPAQDVVVEETLPLGVTFLGVTGATCTGGPAPTATPRRSRSSPTTFTATSIAISTTTAPMIAAMKPGSLRCR